MKKMIALWLMVCMALGCCVPALAGEVEDDLPGEEQAESVVVSTLDELRAAIDAAEDGDTIYLSEKFILLDATLETDKNITLMRSDDFTSGAMFGMYGSTLKGFTIYETAEYSTTIEVDGSTENAVVIQNCNFYGNGRNGRYAINIAGDPNINKAIITHCSFEGVGTAIDCRSNTSVKIENCLFSKNGINSGRDIITNDGEVFLSHCTISNNCVYRAGIFNGGKLIINDCEFEGNKLKSASPERRDIFSTGTLTITDEAQDEAGYYDETTGEKISLPLTDNTTVAKLVYLTTEQAAEYFAPANDPDTAEKEPVDPDADPDDPDLDYSDPDETDSNNPAQTTPVDPVDPVVPDPVDPPVSEEL